MSFPAYPANKESGVEWLGEVPESWSITPLKFCASCNDTVLPDSTDDDYEIEYVEISDVNEISGITGSTSYKFSDAPSRARRMLQDGDVLISTVRTYLRAIAPVVTPAENLIASTGFAVVRPRKGILDGTFLGYLLRAEWWISEVIARSVGVSYPAINASDLIGLDVPVPAWHEQTQIARFLDHETARIDALIEEQQRLIELLKEKRQALISHAVTKGLDPTVPMKDSDVEWLGEVPAHWICPAIKHTCSLIKDGTHLPPARVDDGVPLLSVRNIISGDFVLRSDDSEISNEDYLTLCRAFVPTAGDVLLAIVGATLGKTAVISEGLGEFHIQRSLAIFRADGDKVSSEWLSLIFQSAGFQSLLWEYAGFSAQPGIYLGTLSSFSIPLPSRDEQNQIVRQVKAELLPMSELIETAQETLSLSQERRSALISAAVTGKIDVRGWQPPTSVPTPELVQEAV